MNPMSSKEQAPADIGLLKWSSLGGFLYYALNLIVSLWEKLPKPFKSGKHIMWHWKWFIKKKKKKMDEEH